VDWALCQIVWEKLRDGTKLNCESDMLKVAPLTEDLILRDRVNFLDEASGDVNYALRYSYDG
jgi:hypothetical protein